MLAYHCIGAKSNGALKSAFKALGDVSGTKWQYILMKKNQNY
jgi:hypothetical protein